MKKIIAHLNPYSIKVVGEPESGLPQHETMYIYATSKPSDRAFWLQYHRATINLDDAVGGA